MVSGHIDIVKLLIENGANVSATGGYLALTALHYAAGGGNWQNKIVYSLDGLIYNGFLFFRTSGHN